jgi:Na+/melibiose symporter-like transporter
MIYIYILHAPILLLSLLNIRFRFAASFGYYGISFQTGKLKGDPYLMLFVMAGVEMPSYIFVTLAMDRLGRRFLNSSMMIIGGTALLASAFLPMSKQSSLISLCILNTNNFFQFNI